MLALESSAPMKKPTQRASSGISINPAAAWIVADMLADRNARSLAFGNYNVLETPFWSAVKTGTSKDMRDNWAVGFSKRYTVGVWVGNASGLPMHDVSGVSGAAPIWKDVMLALHARSSAADRAAPPLPSGVVEREVRFSQIAGSSDIEAPRRDFFLADTATAPLQSVSVQSNKASTGSPIITYPTQGTLIALDPDMPPARQRVPLTARYTQGTATLYLNGKPVREPRWFPLPGKHKLELKDTQGVVLDTVRFEVRGAQMKGAGA